MTGFDLLINFIEQFIIFYFIGKFSKLNRKFSYLYFLMFVILGTSIMTFSNVFIGIESYFKIVFILLNFSFCMLFTSNYLGEKILASILPYVIIGLINGFLTITASYFMFNQLNSIELVKSNFFVFLIVLSKVLLFITLYEIAFYRKKYQNYIDNQRIIYIVMLIMFIQFIFILIEGIVYTNSINPIEIIVTVFLLFIFVFGILIYFFVSLKNNDIENEKILNFQMLEFENRRYQEIEMKRIDIQKIKHNLKHVLNNVLTNINENDMTKAKESILDYIDEVDKVYSYGKFNSRVLDFLVNKLVEEAHEKEYTFSYNINLTESLRITDNDFMILLGNALENAVIHSEGDRKIELNITKSSGYFIIKIKNRVNSMMKLNDLENSRRGEFHGYGVKTIREIVTKYDGTITYNLDENFLICTIIINEI